MVCQEHGQILRLLDGRRLRHFSEELGGSARRKDADLDDFQRKQKTHTEKSIIIEKTPLTAELPESHCISEENTSSC